MKKKIFSIFKIYFLLLVFLIVASSGYILYLEKCYTSNIYIELILGAVTFLLIGMLYSNHFQKKGLIIGLIAGILHFFIIKIILMLAGTDFSFNVLEFFIYILSSSIGGFLGITFKKII